MAAVAAPRLKDGADDVEKAIKALQASSFLVGNPHLDGPCKSMDVEREKHRASRSLADRIGETDTKIAHTRKTLAAATAKAVTTLEQEEAATRWRELADEDAQIRATELASLELEMAKLDEEAQTCTSGSATIEIQGLGLALPTGAAVLASIEISYRCTGPTSA